MTASCLDRIDAVLYASMNHEQVAALDFTRSGQDLCINLVFVKPEFRRRGIGSALVRHLVTLYPGMITTYNPPTFVNACSWPGKCHAPTGRG